jgi:hypothetical protein
MHKQTPAIEYTHPHLLAQNPTAHPASILDRQSDSIFNRLDTFASYARKTMMFTWLRSIRRSARKALRRALVLLLALPVFQLGAVHAQDAKEKEQPEVRAQVVTKIVSLLVVGTSGLNTNVDLGNKQALIGAGVRKRIAAGGVTVTPIGIRPEDGSPQATVDQAVAKFKPSHTMGILVPQGTVASSVITGKQLYARDFVVKAEVRDATTGAVVWTFSTDVANSSTINADVAEAIVRSLAKEGLL